MKKIFYNCLDWLSSRESFLSEILIPFLCFLVPCLYQDIIIDAFGETCKQHIVRFRNFIFFGSLAIYFVLWMVRRHNHRRYGTVDDLKNKVSEYESKLEVFQNNIREVFNGLLFNIFSKITNNGNVRISLYYYCNDGFVMIGRYSPCPTLSTPGRGVYPPKEGVIFLGWDDGWAFQDYGSKSDNEIKKIFRRDLNMQAPEKLTMIPRQIAALRVTSESSIPSKRNLGVVVIESRESLTFDEEKLKQDLLIHSEYLATTIRELQDFIPRPEAASSLEM